MRLNFKKVEQKKNTFFIEKIYASLSTFLPNIRFSDFVMLYDDKYNIYSESERKKSLSEYNPKYHSIRKLTVNKNGKKRWHDKLEVEFYTGSRFHERTYFNFAPNLPVVSVQDIKIRWYDKEDEDDSYEKHVTIFIDGQYFYSACFDYDKCLIDFELGEHDDLLKFVQNDGFETVEAFFDWFSEDFEGQIIHWTDLKY